MCIRALYSKYLKWQKEPLISYVSHSYWLYFMWLCWSHCIALKSFLRLWESELFPCVTNGKENLVISSHASLYMKTFILFLSYLKIYERKKRSKQYLRLRWAYFFTSTSIFFHIFLPSFSYVCKNFCTKEKNFILLHVIIKKKERRSITV